MREDVDCIYVAANKFQLWIFMNSKMNLRLQQ